MRKIEWIQDALDHLTQIWMHGDSDLRNAITKACHALEKRLAVDADGEGESRADGRRITFEPPLTFEFRVEAGGQIVTVLKVRPMRPRKS